MESEVCFWPNSFLEEIEGTAPAKGMTIWSLSGPSFLLRTPQTTIYIDPFFGLVEGLYRTSAIPINPANIRCADVVLSSHKHADHCHRPTLQAICENTNAIFVGPASSASLMREYQIPEERIREVTPGDTLSTGDVEFSIFKAHDPGEAGAVTYVISSGGISLFFGGDTSDGPALAALAKQRDIDIVMLAFGRTWYMDEAEVLEVAARFKPTVFIPYHWDIWRDHTGDPVRLGRLWAEAGYDFDIKLLLLGDCFHFEQ